MILSVVSSLVVVVGSLLNARLPAGAAGVAGAGVSSILNGSWQ